MAAQQIVPVRPTSASAVRRALIDELDDALVRLPSSQAPTADDVHEVRKSLKRARAMLRLLRPALESRAYEDGDESMRDAGRRLAAARDARVMADLYAKLSRPRRAAKTRAHRGPLHAAPGSPAASVADARAACVAIRVARDRVARAPLSGLGWATLGEGFRAVYRQARRRMPHDRDSATVASLHAWRRATKRYWHVLEVFQPVRPRRIGAAIRDAHRLSDLLGDDHDLALLSRVVLARRLEPQPADARILRTIRPRRKALQIKALAVGERLYAVRPRQEEASLRRDWERWLRRERPKGSRPSKSVQRQIRRRNSPIAGSKRA